MLGIDPVVKVNVSDKKTGGGGSGPAQSFSPEVLKGGRTHWDLLLDCYVSNRAIILTQNLPVKDNVLDLYKLL